MAWGSDTTHTVPFGNKNSQQRSAVAHRTSNGLHNKKGATNKLQQSMLPKTYKTGLKHRRDTNKNLYGASTGGRVGASTKRDDCAPCVLSLRYPSGVFSFYRSLLIIASSRMITIQLFPNSQLLIIAHIILRALCSPAATI